MIRSLSRGLGLIICSLVFLTLPAMSPAGQAALEQRLWQVMQLDALMLLLRDEALAEVGAMEEATGPAGEGGLWREAVARIHDPDLLHDLFREGAAEELARSTPAVVDAGLDFYDSPLGRRALALELSTRAAILDDEVRQDAETAFDMARLIGDPRAAQIERFIAAGDLLEMNVAGAMNAALAFSRGYDQGGGYRMPMSDRQRLADVWAQETAIRDEIRNWLQGYLFLAYSPLGDEELERYIRFQMRPEGRALARILASGFDRLFTQTSFYMGLAFAADMSGREL